MFRFFKRKPVEPTKPTETSIKSAEPTKLAEPTKAAQPIKLPSKKQLEECERLGLVVKPNMSSREVWQLVEDAKKDPKIKKLYDEYIAEQNAIFEAADREEYGDAIVDELKKWEKVCIVGVHHIVVFKKGKTLDADILEFERANIEEENKYYVKIEGLRPKIYKPRGESPYIEWEREITFRPQQIIELITLPQPIDMFDINGYEETLQKAHEIKEKYQ